MFALFSWNRNSNASNSYETISLQIFYETVFGNSANRLGMLKIDDGSLKIVLGILNIGLGILKIVFGNVLIRVIRIKKYWGRGMICGGEKDC